MPTKRAKKTEVAPPELPPLPEKTCREHNNYQKGNEVYFIDTNSKRNTWLDMETVPLEVYLTSSQPTKPSGERERLLRTPKAT
ncbi:hypothetical protein IMZ48_43330 [Candidatus Bathyarchaeota archaeon]|nr:hypothetical protein [Candidatus Bathyarchaeota archaeon]